MGLSLLREHILEYMWAVEYEDSVKPAVNNENRANQRLESFSESSKLSLLLHAVSRHQ